jgi:hypothetical protein
MMRILTAVLLALFAGAAPTSELVREFTGEGNTTTAIFTVESPWLLDWTLYGDYEQLIALDVTLIEANSGRYIGRVLRTQHKGNGLKLFQQGGSYQLRVSSTLARWRIRIEQITDEEAELYTPRK